MSKQYHRGRHGLTLWVLKCYFHTTIYEFPTKDKFTCAIVSHKYFSTCILKRFNRRWNTRKWMSFIGNDILVLVSSPVLRHVNKQPYKDLFDMFPSLFEITPEFGHFVLGTHKLRMWTSWEPWRCSRIGGYSMFVSKVLVGTYRAHANTIDMMMHFHILDGCSMQVSSLTYTDGVIVKT